MSARPTQTRRDNLIYARVVAVVAAAELDAEDGRVELLVEDERRAGGRGDRLGDVRLGLAVQLHRLRGRGPDRVDGTQLPRRTVTVDYSLSYSKTF